MLFGSVVEKRFPQKGIIRGRGEGRANYFLWAGGILTGVMLLLILVGYVWTPYSTTEMSGADKFLGPCLAHPLGTDNFGRDLLSRIMEGAGSTFSIALCVVLIGGVVGTIIGCLTGYFGGVADLILMRVCDAITAFPSILLALVLIQALCSYFMDYQGHSIGAKMERDMRAQLFRHCQRLSFCRHGCRCLIFRNRISKFLLKNFLR